MKISPIFKEIIIQVFKRPFTRKYPHERPAIPEGFRGMHIFNTDLCIGCGLCYRDCPSGAIELIEIGGKKKPIFHLDLCIFCYQCAESCPREAIKSSGIFEVASKSRSDLTLNATEWVSQ